jgi:hypothetical protein
MGQDDRWAARLSAGASRRRWGRATFLLLAAGVAPLVIHTLGPTTLASGEPSNPFERFDVWLADGTHIDGDPGVFHEVASPATWLAVGVVTTLLIGLALWSLRRPR